MDIEENVDVETEVIRHVEVRGKLYDVINIEAVRSICYMLQVKLEEPKSDWMKPLGNLMGSIMYILDMHSGMNDEDRRVAASAIAASIVTNTMMTKEDKDNATIK